MRRRYGACTSRRRTGGCGRLAFPRWKTSRPARRREVLTAIYETDFLGFSYGFRPERSPHHALDALSVGLLTKKVNWVLDADIRDFFDTLDHGWMKKFLEHRVADGASCTSSRNGCGPACWRTGREHSPRTARSRAAASVRSWPTCTCTTCSTSGSNGGGQKHAHGHVVVVRFADDFVVGFEHRQDAERFSASCASDCAVRPGAASAKTRLIEFGPFADRNRRGGATGSPRPSISSASRTAARRSGMGATRCCGRRCDAVAGELQTVKAELRARLDRPDPGTRQLSPSGRGGHFRYYGVPMNLPALCAFRMVVGRLWWRSCAVAVVGTPCRGIGCVVTSSDGFGPRPSVIPIPSCASALSPRWEPDAVMPHVRICGGGYG